MKKLCVFLWMTLFYFSTTWAQSTCFLVQENQTVLKHEGKDCNQRFAPESTFKIALSLMGFDAGILKIADSKKQATFASFRAKNEALNQLFYLINELEK